MEFKDWINQKYIGWRGDTRKTVTDFAKYIGVSQQIMNQWINDGALPGTRTLPKLAKKYPEVYEILGLPSPDDPLASLPPAWRNRFLTARREYTAELSSKGISIDTPEAREIISEAFKRHGIIFAFTDGEDN